MIVDPSSLVERDAYRLMISAFVPRPIAFVSTRSRAGVDNCAPFSYSMGVSSSPMILAISVGERDGRPKDTGRNILDTREFVVNVVTEEIAWRMNQASGDYADGVSEFDEAGLTRGPSERVRAPRIAESPGLRDGASEDHGGQERPADRGAMSRRRRPYADVTRTVK